MPNVKRALIFSTADRHIALICNFVTLVLVSRLLTPQEIGVSVVGMAVVNTLSALREFASTSYLIQHPDIAETEARATSTAIAALSFLVVLILFLAAPAAAVLYDEPELVPYLRVIAVALSIEVISIPILGMLRRRLAFGRIGGISVAGNVLSSAAALLLAQLGFSYMSFAWAWLVQSVIVSGLCLILSDDVWVLKPWFRNWRPLLNFGAYNGLTNILYRVGEGIAPLALGHFATLNAAAIYSRSLMVGQLPDRVVLGGALSVLLPMFSATLRQGRGLRQTLMRALAIVTGFQWPALLVTSALAEPLVSVLLGQQWMGAVPVVRIMALALMCVVGTQIVDPILLAVGAVRSVFARAAIVTLVSGGVIAFGAMFGVVAVAVAMLVSSPFQTLLSGTMINRHIGTTWRDLGACTWRSAILALAAAIGPYCLVEFSEAGSAHHPVVVLAMGVALAAVGWLAATIATRHILLDEVAAVGSWLRRRAMAKAGAPSATAGN